MTNNISTQHIMTLQIRVLEMYTNYTIWFYLIKILSKYKYLFVNTI